MLSYKDYTHELGKLYSAQFGRPIPAIQHNGTLTDGESKFLCETLARVTQPGPVVEIGVLFGFSLVNLAISAPHRTLLALDTLEWNPYGLQGDEHKSLLQNFLAQHIDMARLSFFTDAETFYNHQTSTPCFVHIDSSHTYANTLQEIKWAQRLQVPYICGHDYVSSHPGVVRAVDEAGGPSQQHQTSWLLATATAQPTTPATCR